MMQAAQEPRTFYGLVARRRLGLPMGFAWDREIAARATPRRWPRRPPAGGRWR
jgi:hypothetical protein